jgi:ketosteroid isomerase-like protein
MGAKSPEDICNLFREQMARGDIESALSLYDSEIAFVSEGGEVRSGLDELRKELAPVAAGKPHFDFEVKLVAGAGDIALMHTWWRVSSGKQEARFVHAIEIARRQPNGEWRWLVGDPFTVGRLSTKMGGACDAGATDRPA